MKSKPPVRLTAPSRSRLRRLFAASLATGLAVCPSLAPARDEGLRILVDATVAERAAPVMPAETWAKAVGKYVGRAADTPAAGSEPTIDGCRAAGDDFLLRARFDLRPRLPGLANSSGRVSAQARLQLVNCVTGATSLDRVLTFDADPDSASEGDFESSGEVTWRRALPAALKRVRLYGRIARVIRLTPPLAYVDFHGVDVKAGDTLSDYAKSDRSARGSVIELAVTQVFDNYVETEYVLADGGPQPAVGDLVEASRP